MKALLLCAGFGTRLRPLTNTVPKCLVPIKGKPLLGIWLERLVEAGIGPFLINTHFLVNQVEEFVKQAPLHSQIRLVYEPKLLGTAGTVIENLDFFDKEDGMLVHADNYCLADIDAFVNAHSQRPSYCLMTMMTFCTENPASCGIVELDSEGVVIGFHEKVENPPSNEANGAVYILSAEMMHIISDKMRECTDFSTEILPNFIGRIYTYHTNQAFIDIGTPENYLKANAWI